MKSGFIGELLALVATGEDPPESEGTNNQRFQPDNRVGQPGGISLEQREMLNEAKTANEKKNDTDRHEYARNCPND